MKIFNTPAKFQLLQSECELLGVKMIVQYKTIDKVFNGMNFGKKAVYTSAFLNAPLSLKNELSLIFNVVFKNDVFVNYENGSTLDILSAVHKDNIKITLV